MSAAEQKKQLGVRSISDTRIGVVANARQRERARQSADAIEIALKGLAMGKASLFVDGARKIAIWGCRSTKLRPRWFKAR